MKNNKNIKIIIFFEKYGTFLKFMRLYYKANEREVQKKQFTGAVTQFIFTKKKGRKL